MLITLWSTTLGATILLSRGGDERLPVDRTRRTREHKQIDLKGRSPYPQACTL